MTLCNCSCCDRMQLTHVCVADAVQVVIVSSVRRIEEERTSCLHRGEHVELPLPSYLAHVCAKRQSAPRVRFPDALEFRILGVLVQNASLACALAPQVRALSKARSGDRGAEGLRGQGRYRSVRRGHEAGLIRQTRILRLEGLGGIAAP